MEKLKVGLFIDTYFPMIDGVVMVVDNYARRLSKYCDVTVFTVTPHKKGDEKEFPYKVVRSKSLVLPKIDYDLPSPVLDRKFKKALNSSKLDIVHIHSPFPIGSLGVKYPRKIIYLV